MPTVVLPDLSDDDARRVLAILQDREPQHVGDVMLVLPIDPLRTTNRDRQRRWRERQRVTRNAEESVTRNAESVTRNADDLENFEEFEGSTRGETLKGFLPFVETPALRDASRDAEESVTRDAALRDATDRETRDASRWDLPPMTDEQRAANKAANTELLARMRRGEL